MHLLYEEDGELKAGTVLALRRDIALGRIDALRGRFGPAGEALVPLADDARRLGVAEQQLVAVVDRDLVAAAGVHRDEALAALHRRPVGRAQVLEHRAPPRRASAWASGRDRQGNLASGMGKRWREKGKESGGARAERLRDQ